MANVCVLQTDNRLTLPYLLETQKVNKKCCELLGYTYVFVELHNHAHGRLHPATKKIPLVYDFLRNSTCDILVFLDSDAWIQNGAWLNDVIGDLIKDESKWGCFSRDPYLKINTFINSGSFILKNNDFTRQMYQSCMQDVKSNPRFHHTWPYDQHYISNYVFKHKENFVVFLPDVMNTPIGKVLRHNWRKNQKMYDDLRELYHSLTTTTTLTDACVPPFITQEHYDTHEFPNKMEKGYEYDC
jgi:hypothetical protein